MTRTSLLLAMLCGTCCAAQEVHHAEGMAMDKPAAARSTSLVITGLGGVAKTLSSADLASMPHVTVHVHNAHSNADESYGGVAVRDLLQTVRSDNAPKTSANMQIVVAGATDGFHVVLTLCDTNPDCRSGQVIVADQQDGKPIGRDGAFKLILTEDRKPARWVRNLSSLSVRAVDAE